MEAEANAAKPPPTSPRVSPLQPGECIEELLKAVLQWSINGTLGLDIGLSPEFCSALLSEGGNDDHSSALHASSSTDISERLPYKSLASALHQSMISSNFDNTWNQSREEREDLLPSKGSELLAILKKINFGFHVREPFFSQLKEGLKTVEGRCAVGDYNRICPGALILISKCLAMEVVDVHHYISFAKMLETEGLSKVLRGVSTIGEGVAIYRRFYTEEREKLNGVLALCVSKTAPQPYMVLANIIAILGYQGIQSLLGFQHAIEKDVDAHQPA